MKIWFYVRKGVLIESISETILDKYKDQRKMDTCKIWTSRSTELEENWNQS